MNSLNKSKNKIKLVALILSLGFFLFQIMQICTVSASAPDNLNNTGGEPDFCIAVDYYAEKIRILNPNSLLGRYGTYDYIEIADNDSVISGISTGIGKSDLAENISVAHDGEYMYALKAVPDMVLDSYVNAGKPERKTAALMKEKWYPIYGGGFDIKSVIPTKAAKDPRKQYYIAIRKADDYFDTENGYQSRITVCIKPRYNQRSFNNFIEYDAKNEKIVLSSSYPDGDYVNIIYRYDYFDSIKGILTNTKNNSYFNANINVPAKLFSQGGYVYISSLPIVADGQYGPEVTFARSKEIKFKIPKVPAVPAVRTDDKLRKITSLKKDVLEWSLTISDNPDSWQPYNKTDTALFYKDVLNTFGLNEYNIDGEGNYVIYFRVKAVENKSPVSLPKKILIPADLCY